MSSADAQRVEDFDYVELCTSVESFFEDYERLPHINLSEMHPSDEARRRLKALNEAVAALTDRADSELPAGFDLRPVVLVRQALATLHRVTLGGYYSPFRGRTDANPESLAAYDRSRTAMLEAVTLARRLRDHEPNRPRVERLVAAVGARRALELLASDLNELRRLIDSELPDDARAELHAAANLVARSAVVVARTSRRRLSPER